MTIGCVPDSVLVVKCFSIYANGIMLDLWNKREKEEKKKGKCEE